jgi:hypothetical protein
MAQAAIGDERIRTSASLRAFLADGQEAAPDFTDALGCGFSMRDTPPQDGMWTVPSASSIAWLSGFSGVAEAPVDAAPMSDGATADAPADSPDGEAGSSVTTCAEAVAPPAMEPQTRRTILLSLLLILGLKALHSFDGRITLYVSRLCFSLAATFGLGVLVGLRVGVDAAQHRGDEALPSPLSFVVSLVAKPPPAMPPISSTQGPPTEADVAASVGAITLPPASAEDGGVAPLADGGSSLPACVPTASFHEHCWAQPDAAFFMVRARARVPPFASLRPVSRARARAGARTEIPERRRQDRVGARPV